MGGLLVELVAVASNVISWQNARREARASGDPQPGISNFIDLPADSLVAITRLALGALAGMAFHNGITEELAAIAVGASAPALLQQIGAARASIGLDREKES
jgi:hypothetical protein